MHLAFCPVLFLSPSAEGDFCCLIVRKKRAGQGKNKVQQQNKEGNDQYVEDLPFSSSAYDALVRGELPFHLDVVLISGKR